MILPHLPQPHNSAAKLHRCSVDLPQAVIDRVGMLAPQVSASLGCDVSRASFSRAALTSWFAQVERLDADATLQTILLASPRFGTPLQRVMLAWPNALHRHLERLRKEVSPKLFCTVVEGRSALVLAALQPFVVEAERRSHEALDHLREAVLKRGRKVSS